MSEDQTAVPALSRRRFLRTAVIGAAAAVATRGLGDAPAFADPIDIGQVTMGALLLTYVSAPLNARGTVQWTVTKQRTDTLRISNVQASDWSISQETSLSFGPNDSFSVNGSETYKQGQSTQVSDAVVVKSTQSWGLGVSGRPENDGYATVDDTAFFMIAKPKVEIKGNPTKGFHWKFLDGGIKMPRTVRELRTDPVVRAFITPETADSILAQYPLLSDPSGIRLGLRKPRFKLREQIAPNESVPGLSFERTVGHGSTHSEDKTATVSATIVESFGFNIGIVKEKFSNSNTIAITHTSVNETDSTQIITSSGTLNSQRNHINYVYVDRVWKTICITDEGPLTDFPPTLAGSITDGGGAAIAGAVVGIQDGDVFRGTSADNQGNYQVHSPEPLSPGSYPVICGGVTQFANLGGGTATVNYVDLDPFEARTSPVGDYQPVITL